MSPTAQSFVISKDGWKFLQSSPMETLWVNETIPDIMAQRFSPHPPNDLPADYPNIDSHLAMFEAVISKEGGAVVSVDLVTVKDIEAFQTIFKFRMPSNGLGKRYLATLMFPFETFFCGFSFQCDEFGPTGLRENLAHIVETKGKKPERDPDAPPPTVLKSMDEFFDRIKQAPITRNPSDDEKYDELVPTHPLSRTRNYLKWLKESLEFDEGVHKSKPYRGIEKRSASSRFWNKFKRN